MKHFSQIIFLLLILTMLATGTISALDTSDTRMMSQPAISDSHIAFIYAEDLWVCDLDGSRPRRLTVDEGVESGPSFSPDGKLIAFSAEYDGNRDVFLIPAEGGIPRRLTWHPGPDIVRGFTPDGTKVLFMSQREVFSRGHAELFTIPLEGGFPEKLVVPNAVHAAYSPDGGYLAYTPLPEAFRQWKHYRGGRISRIWIFSFEDHSVLEIPKPKGGCNDTNPIWIGDDVYFLSDRNGEFNIFRFNRSTGEVEQLTRFDDFPVLAASGKPGAIVFEQAGYLHTMDLENSEFEKVTIGIAADLQELRSRFVSGREYLRSAGISPTGARAVVDYRGDILTLPAEKGDFRNLTETTGTHERFPEWSPDGKWIAYISDESGENELVIQPRDGKGESRNIKLEGTGFYAYLNWSPDSRKITYVDNGRNLYLLDVESGDISRIDSDALYVPGPYRDMFGDWAHDSRWFSYTRVTDTQFRQAFLYSLDQQKSFPVTDGLSDVQEPVFDPGGKYLYLLASTDAGPVLNWFDQSTADMRMTSSIYLVTLQEDTKSPFARESDEESVQEDEGAEEDGNGNGTEDDAEKEQDSLRIDIEGIFNRIVDFPVKPGSYSNLSSGSEGEVFYIAQTVDNALPPTLQRFSLKDRKEESLFPMVSFTISADGKKMLYMKNGRLGIVDAGKKAEGGEGMLDLGSVQVKIDPSAEWAQIFDEVWRINRDYFYDPGMHGADWAAMKGKYAPFLPHLSCTDDLDRLLQWMCSELAVGHHRHNVGDSLFDPERIKGGLLGADFEIVENRYRIRRIFEGLNWNPEMRSPLTEPGVNVNVGDYILKVEGEELTGEDNIYRHFENTAGKITEIAVGSSPDGADSRVAAVVPLESESSLRNRAWVEGNLKKVTEATDGQVAYVYVPDTAGRGHDYFKRYFFPQANRKAIIVDERFNGGGLIADYYIDILRRPYQAHWHTRYGQDLKTPSASIQGPKVMIINEVAGSGGDMLPWMFRKFEVGTLVGKRTWGGLVGILGFPQLLDGGSVTAPNLAIWTEDGFIVENVGVPPDIEVEQLPAKVIEGHDPQLEKAIEVIMEQLRENPPPDPERPPYPERAGD